jgi:hypothetical protein
MKVMLIGMMIGGIGIIIGTKEGRLGIIKGTMWTCI